jgi:hypothetical protein
MLRRTSKRVKEVVDKILLSTVTVVRLIRRFWYDVRNGMEKEKSHLVLNQLMTMTVAQRLE